ncbi:MAG: hypothetical protein N3A69_14705, partial [Leptospiraceae bacterium]|nr:hypothetical protein [Leptospiraceae bacterium]
MFHKVLFVILGILFSQFVLSAEELDFIDAYKIEYFEVKDFNRNTFTVEIRTTKDESYLNHLFSIVSMKLPTGEKVSKTFYYFDIIIGDIKTDVVPGTLKASHVG